MKNHPNFMINKLQTNGLDRGARFAIIIIVNPTAFSVRRDSGFYL